MISATLLITDMTNPGYGLFSNMTLVQKDYTSHSNPENLSANFRISEELKNAINGLVFNSNSTNAAVVLG